MRARGEPFPKFILVTRRVEVSIKRSIRNKACRMKTAAVTGASKGIGRAVALKLAREGFRVIAIARDAAALASLAKEAESVTPFEADLADAAAVGRVADHLTAREIDVLVNNAGIAMSAPIHKTSDATTRASWPSTSRRRSC